MKRFHTPEEVISKKMRCCQGNIIHCLADTCMAWRWKSKETRWVREDETPPEGWVATNHPEATLSLGREEKSKYTEYEKVETEATGYCGLAHSPSWND